MATATPTYGITQTSTTAGFVYAAKGNSANVPVTYVSWGDAARFVNWLANGEPSAGRTPHDGNRRLCLERQHGQRGAHGRDEKQHGDMGVADGRRVVQGRILQRRRDERGLLDLSDAKQ